MANESTPSQAVDEFTSRLKRTELQHQPSSIPGREIVQVLTEIPVGVESGWHTHPGEEVGYILAGTVEMKIEGQPTLMLRAGDPFLMPPGTPHNALDVGPGTGQMLSTYIVEIGKPSRRSSDDRPRHGPPPTTELAEQAGRRRTYVVGSGSSPQPGRAVKGAGSAPASRRATPACDQARP